MIEKLPEQILKGLDNDLYQLSLFTTLTLPDIGGAIDSGSSVSNGKRYKKWFNKYAEAKFTHLSQKNFTAHTCWKIRCSLLHQGSSKHDFLDLEYPNSFYSPGVFGSEKESLKIDINLFCKKMVDAFNDWIEDVENTDKFKKESQNIARISKGIFKIAE